MDVVRYDLGEEAVDYIRSFLEEGKELHKTLAELLLNQLDLREGQVYTYLPPGLSAEQVNSFKWGGVVPVPDDAPIVRTDGVIIVPIYSTQEHLTQFVRQYLSNVPQSIALFGNWLYDWLPPEEEIRFVIVGDNEVYTYLLETDTDPGMIDRSISTVAMAYPSTVGILSRIPEQALPSWSVMRRPGTVEELAYLVRHAQFLIAEAYDLEGFLIWERSTVSLH